MLPFKQLSHISILSIARESDPPRNSNRVAPSTSESSNETEMKVQIGDEMERSSIDSCQHDSEKV